MRSPPQEFDASPQPFARANSALEEALQTLQTEGVLVGGPAAVMRARELLSPLSGRPSATTVFLEEDKAAAAAAMAAHTQNHTALTKAVEVATKAAARAAAKSEGIYVLPKVVDRAFVASMGRPSVVTGGTEVDRLDPRNHRQPPALSNCHSGRRQPSPEEHLIAVAISGQLRTFTIEFVWRNIFTTMVQPIQHHANVFMALDSWSKDMGPFVDINGTRRVVEVDLLPNHTLPKALFQLFKPVAVEWGHAGTPATCEGDGHRCLFDFNPSDNKCFGLGDARMGQAYHFWRVSRLIRFHEQACGVHHDWVLRLRPDTVFARRLPPIRFWPPQVLRRPPPPTLYAQDLTAVGVTAVSDTWALMTRDVAKVYLEEHLVDAYTFPSCTKRTNLELWGYHPYKWRRYPEGQLSYTLRTKLPAQVDVCSADRNAQHPKEMFLLITRPEIGPTTHARQLAVYELWRRTMMGIEGVPDELLPTITLTTPRVDGWCWSNATNPAYDSLREFEGKGNETYEARQAQFWAESNQIFYGVCRESIEPCGKKYQLAMIRDHAIAKKRYDWPTIGQDPV